MLRYRNTQAYIAHTDYLENAANDNHDYRSQTTGSNRTLSDDWSWRYFWEGEKHSFDVCLERCAIRRNSAQLGAILRNSLSTRPRAATGGPWSTRSFSRWLR